MLQILTTRLADFFLFIYIFCIRKHRGLSETLRSRLDSHQTALAAKRACPVGHKIVISNLEPSVTSEDIRVRIVFCFK